MKIDINKDFEEAYQHSFWRGLTGKESLMGAIALAAGAGAAFLAWKMTGLPANVCAYFGVPAMLPIVVLGVFKYQGSGAWGLAKDMLYMLRTRKLAYEPGEYGGSKGRAFFMERKGGKN